MEFVWTGERELGGELGLADDEKAQRRDYVRCE